MKKIKDILTNVLYGMLRSYEGKRFVPSLIAKLVMALVSAIITAFFANTLFSQNNIANQIFAALFFYFLITAVSNLIREVKRGGIGKRLKNTFGNMVCLKPPALWFFIAAVIIALFLPYAFVLALAVVLFVSAVSGENSMLLGIKNAVTKGEKTERSGKGLAAFTSGLIVCGLVVCILANLGMPTVYGVIDGSNFKSNNSQTETVGKDDDSTPDMPSDADDISDNQTINSDSNDVDVIVSSDTNVTETAQILTDKIIEYAGNDRTSFEKLFRNTESSVIDQYYNTSYEIFKEYGNSLIAIAAQDSDSVWFTALYYQIPENYPQEKEKAVYLSTIMTLGNDGWKIEWNDNTRSMLQSKYDNAGFSSYGLDAKDMGYAWAKFFIPVDYNTAKIFYDGAVMCKLTEMYIDEGDNLNLTFYASNGTDKDVEVTNVDITVFDGEQQLFSKNFEVNTIIQKDDGYLFVLKIYSDEIDFVTWNSPRITDFKFSYNEAE